MAGYIDATLTQNNQGHFHQDVPNHGRASPTKQETNTIHHIPSDQVSFGPAYDNSKYENTYFVCFHFYKCIPYVRHYKPLLIRNRSRMLTHWLATVMNPLGKM